MTKGRNIAIFLDGTWNTPESRTNVYTLYEQTQGLNARPLTRRDTQHQDGQLKYYDQGVGTMWGNLVLGGALGYGLDRNLGEAFGFLCRHYQPGDDIYIFGFSRGAYTARSLSGLIRRIGLLEGDPDQGPGALTRRVDSAVSIYRDWPRAPRDEHADRNVRNAYHARLAEAEARLDALPGRLGEAPRVRYLGVWDTVGALGLPRRFRFGAGVHDRYAFHDTELSPIVDHAYQALAIDEHRAEFDCVLWSRRYPENQDVEQRWFVGAHADVGGGYLDNYLNHYPRRWMQEKAERLGLAFFHPLEPRTDVLEEPVSDSYTAFAFGLLKKFAGGRFYRAIHSGDAIDEVIDCSVAEYLKRHRKYRPQNLPNDFLDRALADLPKGDR